MNRTIEHFELLRLVDNDKFFVSIFDMPFKTNEHCLESYVNQIRLKVLDKLKDVYGVDTSDEAMRKAVELHNRVCRAITAIGEFRKEENPRITGYEFHVLCLATYACPKYLIVDKLEETLEEIRHREPDPKKFYRARIVLVGSEIDDPDFTNFSRTAARTWLRTDTASVRSPEERKSCLTTARTCSLKSAATI